MADKQKGQGACQALTFHGSANDHKVILEFLFGEIPVNGIIAF